MIQNRILIIDLFVSLKITIFESIIHAAILQHPDSKTYNNI